MQIKAIMVNAINKAEVQSGQRSKTLVQINNSMFTPQCRVSISKEGKRLSGQQTVQQQEDIQEAAARRIMLRHDEESEWSQKITDGYREQLNNIQKEIRALNKSSTRSATKETIEKEQEVLRAMREQKQAQLEENQRRTKEAQELAAMRSSKYQNDIDGNNRDLWVMLKTLEEAEKAEEEQEGVYTEEDGGSDTPEAENSVGDMIQNSASKFIAASMRRDKYVEGKLEELNNEGHRLVDLANAITNNILIGIKNTMAALDDENYTDDMRAKLMDNFQKEAMSSYGDVARYRGNGLHILQEVRDYRIKRIADDPLAGMQETKDSMMLSAADAALGEARQSYLDETSKELQEEVRKLIDKRNDVNRAPEEEKVKDAMAMDELGRDIFASDDEKLAYIKDLT